MNLFYFIVAKSYIIPDKMISTGNNKCSIAQTKCAKVVFKASALHATSITAIFSHEIKFIHEHIWQNASMKNILFEYQVSKSG